MEIMITGCRGVREVPTPIGHRYVTWVPYKISASTRELARFFYFCLQDMVNQEPSRFVRMERADGSDIPFCDEPPPPPPPTVAADGSITLTRTHRGGGLCLELEQLPSGVWEATGDLLDLWTCTPPSGEVTIRLNADSLWKEASERLPLRWSQKRFAPTAADLIPAGGLTSPAITITMPEAKPRVPPFVAPEPGAAIIRQP